MIGLLAFLAAGAAPVLPPVAGPRRAAPSAPSAAAPALPATGAGQDANAGGPAIGYLTAGQLAEQCRAEAAFPVTYCFAFLAGVRDTLRAYERWLQQSEFCPPAAIKQRDLREALLRFVSGHPGAAEGQAASVAVVAFKQAWPCPPQSR